MKSTTIRVQGLAEGDGVRTPLRCGVPIPEGLLQDAARISLKSPTGEMVAAQSCATGYWDDGSIKWLLLDFLGGAGTYAVELDVEPADSTSALSSTETDEVISVDTGAMQWRVSRKDFRFPGSIEIDGKIVAEPGGGELLLEGEHGGSFKLVADEVSLETTGPVRATICAKGRYLNGGCESGSEWTLRMSAYAGSGQLVIHQTHINGQNVLETKTMGLKLSVKSGLVDGAGLVTSIDGKTLDLDAVPGRILQNSSVKPEYPAFNQFEPVCRAESGGEEVASGKRSDGWALVRAEGMAVGIGLREMWQRYPKGFSFDEKGGALSLEMVPDTGEPYDWMANRQPEQIAPSGARWSHCGHNGTTGMALTEEWMLSFSSAAKEVQQELEAFCAIADALADPAWLVETEALGKISVKDDASFPEAEKQMDRMIEWVYRHQNEWSNMYGIAYGTISTHYQPHFKMWSHLTERFGNLNLEADVSAGLALHYLRSGDRRSFLLHRSLVRHDTDVATIQLPWHSQGMSRRHHTYPWGMPADWSHTFMNSQAMFWYMTGDGRVRDVIRLTEGAAERAKSTGSTHRSTHNTIRACLWIYEITHEKRFRDKAESIMMDTIDNYQDEMGFVGQSPMFMNLYLTYAMELYDRTLKSPKVARALEKMMRAQSHPNYVVGCDDWGIWLGFAKACRESGDTSFLIPGFHLIFTMRQQGNYSRKDEVLRFPRGNYRLMPPDGEVKHDSFNRMYSVGITLAKLPYFLRAAKDAGMCEKAYRELCDADQEKAVETYAVPVGYDERKFVTVDLAPSSNAGFHSFLRSHDEAEGGTIDTTGQRFFDDDNHVAPLGLCWGGTARYAGVPYLLGKPEGDNLIMLKGISAVSIAVDAEAESLHFLGQVHGSGSLEHGKPVARYRIEYDDGAEDEVEWKNLVNCEDWRLDHIGPETELIQCYSAMLFEDEPNRARTHINHLAVPVGGRKVRMVHFESIDPGASPVLYALTVEQAGRAAKQEPVVRLPEWSQYIGMTESEEFKALEPGRYRLELEMESETPMLIDVGMKTRVKIQDGDDIKSERQLLRDWHLLGQWRYNKTRQRVDLDVEVGDGEQVTFCISSQERSWVPYKMDPGGGSQFDIGWVWLEDQGRWVVRSSHLLPSPSESMGRGGRWRSHDKRWIPDDPDACIPRWRVLRGELFRAESSAR